MAWWAIELSEFGIQYEPCLELKGKILAEFLAELPQPDMNSDNASWWILNVDSASHQTGVEVGLQLRASTEEKIEHAIRLNFPASNNKTEYEAILAGVNLVKFVSLEKLIIHSDSQLVVGQVNREYEKRDQRMVKYASLVRQLLGSFATWKLEHILRDSNEKADALEVVTASILIKETVFIPIYYQLTSSIQPTK